MTKCGDRRALGAGASSAPHASFTGLMSPRSSNSSRFDINFCDALNNKTLCFIIRRVRALANSLNTNSKLFLRGRSFLCESGQVTFPPSLLRIKEVSYVASRY